MEGSILILASNGLILLGTHVGHSDRRVIRFWPWIFILNVIGVGELRKLSAFGCLGGSCGRLMWWGLLILPFIAGWALGVARILATLIGRLEAGIHDYRENQLRIVPR
jgi:hypothetical protein